VASLVFEFQECIDEVQSISRFASSFLEPHAVFLLDQFAIALKGVRSSPAGSHYRLQIPLDDPVRTNTSYGEYEPDGNGEHNVRAELSSVWEISPNDPAATKTKPHRTFALSGLASTRVRIVQVLPGNKTIELARWRMEIGDDASPGTYFHVQVLGEDGDAVFPKSLPVPRFPGLLITPMAVLEFALAEIFQDGWPKHLVNETADLKRWRPIQQRRLLSSLEWQRNAIKAAIGSPWTMLKRLKPTADESLIFCGGLKH
jgi:hypothetical protein